ncbi:class I SAM-dependent methyltransferase [Kordiimonas sp. SCSIO 12610]|uniref:class I SAM-dependent methyltransferase n=1 Tax=Kordiimonas sp. SCSIO 12610 TaxID=2829597 RepID=UPI00210E47A4|nr:class I SAM-dependent methyltransferase [Kordiimonas sp. SCSIO 12610]UTW54199.1 class I SAM-dependent methyltransferase [Kordiimonas sp. SCSIO 12610]
MNKVSGLTSAIITGALALSIFSFDILAISPDFIDDALVAPERKRSDKNRDPLRKPAEVLRFLGLQEGDTVLDIFSGGGYYTEILSRSVGQSGNVTAHNNQAYRRIMSYDLEDRYNDRRLANVTLLQAEPADLKLDNDTYDFVIMALAYHDFYIQTDDWPEFDVNKMLREVFKSVKKGGVVGIIDHVAISGSGHSVAQKLHRIDPELVIAEMKSVGFVLEAESDILANDSDPHDIPMWDPSVRGRTDRFILKFRKP